MLNNLKNNLQWIFYILGILIYTIFIFIDRGYFPMLIIFLIALLYLWVIIAVLNNQYSTKQFIYSICGVGFLIATTIFFMNALVEPTHIEIDAKYGTQNLSNHVIIEVEQKQPRPSEGLQSNEQAEWEEATIEDIESGEWEPI